jgi:hypothetical protein
MCPVHRRRRWSKTLAIFLWWADCERQCETCIAVGTGSAVILKACHVSSPSQWEAQGSGARLTTPRGFICYACARSDQLRLSGADRNRSSMKGLAVGTNVASESAISASSSANTVPIHFTRAQIQQARLACSLTSHVLGKRVGSKKACHTYR